MYGNFQCMITELNSILNKMNEYSICFSVCVAIPVRIAPALDWLIEDELLNGTVEHFMLRLKLAMEQYFTLSF